MARTPEEKAARAAAKPAEAKGGALLRELRKQAVDQPLHLAWAFATALPLALLVGLGSRHRSRWAALGWFTVSTVAIVVREVLQWPSSRPWDPWLDWSFFALGYGLAAVAGVIAWRHR